MKRPALDLSSLRKRMSRKRTSYSSEKRAYFPSSIQDVSIWFIIFRVFQFLLACGLLALAFISRAHLHTHPISTDIVFFTFAITAIYLFLITITHIRLHRSGHPQNRLGKILFLLVEFLVMVFWFATLVFVARDARLLKGRGLYIFNEDTSTSSMTALTKRQYYDYPYYGYDGSDGYYPDEDPEPGQSGQTPTFVYFSQMALMCMDLLAGLSALEFLLFFIGFIITLTTLYRAGRALENTRNHGLALQSIPATEAFHDASNTAPVTPLPAVYEPSLHSAALYSPNSNSTMGHETSDKDDSAVTDNGWAGARSERADREMTSQIRKVKSVPTDRNGREKGEYGRLGVGSRGGSPVNRL